MDRSSGVAVSARPGRYRPARAGVTHGCRQDTRYAAGRGEEPESPVDLFKDGQGRVIQERVDRYHSLVATAVDAAIEAMRTRIAELAELTRR